MRLLRVGHAEPLKAGWHAAMLVLVAGAALYNGAAWVVRSDRHLLRNAGGYGFLAALEWRKVRQHLASVPRGTTVTP